MRVIAIIPARYSSTRLNGKPLLDIAGKPMVQHVYERTKKAGLVEDVLVATDDKRIFDAVSGFGGRAVMTLPGHGAGTERVAEAAGAVDADVIVNVQGDEPLIRPEMIDEVIRPFTDNPALMITTLKTCITDKDELNNPNVVKVVTGREGFALYFSRMPIPYVREHGYGSGGNPPVHYKHIGIYAYQKSFLLKFAGMKPTPLEETEKLEQLRALENGYRIKVVETKYNSLGVDTQEDLERVRKIVSSKE